MAQWLNGSMADIAFIYTPESFENVKDSSGLNLIAKTLLPAERFIESRTGVDLNIALKKFQKENVNHIIISSGDGTISRVMTAIHSAYPENNFPKLTILPSGNTNLIAYDVGAKRRDVKYLLDILYKRIKLTSVFRHTLEVSFPKTDRLPQLGMFGGAGFYETAVNFSRGEVEEIAPHRLAIVATILRISLGLIFSKKENNIHYIGTQMPWKNFHFSKGIFFTLLTSLESLPYRMWPFWNEAQKGTQEKGIKFLRISSLPETFPKAIIPLVFGKIPRWIRESKDYETGKTSEIFAKLKANFILDGEFIEPSDTGEVKISLGPEIEFLV